MHWTLVTLLALCGLCAASNAVIYRRGVRTAGILICAGWAVQQAYWWIVGRDSFALFLACDLTIITWFLTRRRRFDASERLIAATIPLTTALGLYAEIHGGHTAQSWWANWWIVAGQMVIGLPLLQPFFRVVERINRSFDPWRHFDLRKRHKA